MRIVCGGGGEEKRERERGEEEEITGREEIKFWNALPRLIINKPEFRIKSFISLRSIKTFRNAPDDYCSRNH